MAGQPVERLMTGLPGGEATKAIYAFPLHSTEGVVWGSLTGILDLAVLERRFDENAAAGFIVSLFDENGLVLVSSNARLRGRDLGSSPLVRDLLRRPVHLTSSYRHPVPAVAHEVLGAVSPVGGTGWGLLIERPTKEAYAPVRVAQVRTLVVQRRRRAGGAGARLRAQPAADRPAPELTGISSEIADGNFAVRANVEGTDELARLASNFNHMAGSIEALVRRLKQALRQNRSSSSRPSAPSPPPSTPKTPTPGATPNASARTRWRSPATSAFQDEVFRVRTAAILHDVGKLGIRDGILNKPAGSRTTSTPVMQQHTAIGAQIMEPIRMLKEIIPGIRNTTRLGMAPATPTSSPGRAFRSWPGSSESPTPSTR